MRKIAALFQQFEEQAKRGGSVDPVYLKQLIQLLLNSEDLDHNAVLFCKEILALPLEGYTSEQMVRMMNRGRHQLYRQLGSEPADWDLFLPEESRSIPSGQRKTLPINLYLDDIRSPFNLGSIFRTSDAFGVEKIYLSEDCPSPDHVRAKRSAMGCTDFIDWERQKLDKLVNTPVFALELGGTPIGDFSFPPGGVAIIGSEELGVSPEGLALADKSLGRVSIPSMGVKGSLNVSVAAGILLHAWFQSISDF